jgi:O-antigen/teichoic acid export membrane protein
MDSKGTPSTIVPRSTAEAGILQRQMSTQLSNTTVVHWSFLGSLARAQLARNSVWAFIGAAVSQSSSLLAALMIGRMLEVTKFGQLALIQSTVLLLGNLGEAGLTLTTTKFVGRWKASDPAKAGRLMARSMLVTAVSGAVMAVLLLAVARYTDAFPPASVSLAAAACGLLIFDMLNRIQFGALAGLEAFREAAQVYVCRGILLLPCIWIGTRYNDLSGAVAAMAAVSLVMFLVGHRVLRRQCALRSISLRPGTPLEQDIVSTSLSLWASSLLMTGSTWIVTFMLSRQAGGFAELGLFNAADRWKIALLFLPNVLFQVVLPMLSRSHAAGDHRSCAQIISMAIAGTAAVTGVAALGVFLLSPLLMSWFGESFRGGVGVLSLAALGSIVSALSTVGSGVLWSLGRPTQMLGIDCVRTFLLVGLCVGGLGTTAWNVALAYLLSSAAGCVLVLMSVHRQLRTDQNHAGITSS